MRPNGGAARLPPHDPRFDDRPLESPTAARLPQRGDRLLAAAAARQAARREPAGWRRPLVADAAHAKAELVVLRPRQDHRSRRASLVEA